MFGYVYRCKLKTLCFITMFSIFCFIIVQIIIFFIRTKNPIPILIWWTPFMSDSYRTISCSNEQYKCLITADRIHKRNEYIGAYLFYGSHIENHDFPLPRNGSILWAVFHEESPRNYAPFLFKETQRLFNVTSTFSRYSDFPVTLQYLNDLNLIKDTKYYVPVEIKNKYLNDISPILYIQSDCDTPIGRDYFVKELGKYVGIDSYGKCLTNKAFPKELNGVHPLDFYDEKLLSFISKYKFIIAFENSVCDDYITEKLWRPLIVGSIPIYLGSPTIEDWLPNNNSAILVQNFENLKAIADLIRKVNENDTAYESFLGHKLKSKITNRVLKNNILKDHPISSFECYVCKEVHKNDHNYRERRQNIYNCPKFKAPNRENTWYQHWEIGRCQSKALKLLINRDRPYSPELFDRTWKEFLRNENC